MLDKFKYLMNRSIEYFRLHKVKTLLLLVLCVFIGAGFTYWSVEATSTPEFCISCHEIQPAYDSWKESSHYKVPADKEIATCRDCHLPSWKNPVVLLWAKAYHGSKDVYHHIVDKDKLDRYYYRYMMKIDARKNFPDAYCLKCHSDIYQQQEKELIIYHKNLKTNSNLKCVDCHKNLVHTQYEPTKQDQ
jgi:nitrate/TMAO reductase-like tetraheme cytochrome c subunit